MKRITWIVGPLLLAFVLVMLFHVFTETDVFLRETITSVGGKNVLVDVCPIFTDEIPKNCSPATNQKAAISSLLKARKQFPPSHPESQQKFWELSP